MIKNLQATRSSSFASTTTDPVVLCAADDNYVLPLCVTLHSAASHLKKAEQLNVVLIDGGISEQGWAQLKESLVDVPIEIQVIRPDRELVNNLMTSHHITQTAYYRLFAAKLLPEYIDKVIYLDSDVLVQDDLTDLWNYELNNNYCLAVPDIACPYVDARTANANYRKSCPYLAALSPIPNWQQLGLDGDQHYFNSGVMVLNLARWRDEQIETKLLACLQENEKFVWCWDQYALNVVFAGQWGQLPLRWNQGAHVFEYPDVSCAPVDEQQFIEMRDNPAIIHYTTEWKPWQYRPFHPLREKFFEYLDRTAWRGWRPEKPSFRIADWWTHNAVELTKRFTISYRKFKTKWN